MANIEVDIAPRETFRQRPLKPAQVSRQRVGDKPALLLLDTPAEARAAFVQADHVGWDAKNQPADFLRTIFPGFQKLLVSRANVDRRELRTLRQDRRRVRVRDRSEEHTSELQSLRHL